MGSRRPRATGSASARDISAASRPHAGPPTVGPLLYRALLSQDMYLAGSLLMLLCALTLVGTFVSDILLVWLDPRIRFEGGSR